LTEVAQLAGDFNTGSNYVASGLPKFKNLAEAGYIIQPDREINVQELPDISDSNLKTEVLNCISALASNKMEVLSINTIHSQLEIPAFYTIIPGAHFRERSLGTSVAMFSAKHIYENRSPEKAVLELRNIDTILPGKYFIQFYLGAANLALHNPRTGLVHLRQALTLEPTAQDIPSIYSYIGVALKDMGEYRQALENLQEGEKLDNRRTDIYNLMGFCHFKLKEHEKAIENFKKVIDIDPSSAIDYANIASNYRQMGEKHKAIQYYQTALDLDPTIQFAQEQLQELLR
jgi:ribosomal protein S12 methylthiotransferase accessory factor